MYPNLRGGGIHQAKVCQFGHRFGDRAGVTAADFLSPFEDGWQVSGTTPMAGLSGGHGHAAVVLCYQVDDIHAAVRRVRENGGRAGEPAQRPYGLLADCTDNQGTRFYLAQ